jgi:hypothetical protein
MVGDLLRHFQLAAVLQIRRDAGRAEQQLNLTHEFDPKFKKERFSM